MKFKKEMEMYRLEYVQIEEKHNNLVIDTQK